MNIIPLAELARHIGREVALSDWLRVDQDRIDGFAEVTGDHQWIHVDRARAAAGPFGTTVAHGYLTLSLIPLLMSTSFRVDDVRERINYGLDKVRFPAPLPVDSEVRVRATLTEVTPTGRGVDMGLLATVEIRDEERPACVAATRTRLIG